MLSPKKKKEGGGGLIPPLGGNPGKKRQTVEQELHIVKTRYLPTPKRAGSPSRLSRLRPETRGWTPVSEPLSLTHIDLTNLVPGTRSQAAYSPQCDRGCQQASTCSLHIRSACPCLRHMADGSRHIDVALCNRDAKPEPGAR